MLCVCVGDVIDCCVFCLFSEASSCRCSCMGSMSVLSCRFLKSRLLVYPAGSGMNRMQAVLSVFSVRLLCFVQTKTVCMYGCMHLFAALVCVCRCDGDVICICYMVSLKCKC